MKISIEQYQQFEADFKAGKYPHQRFGQAFENAFEVCEGGVILTPVTGAPWTERINEHCIWNAGPAEAVKKIFEHYIDFASGGSYPQLTDEEIERLRNTEYVDDGDRKF